MVNQKEKVLHRLLPYGVVLAVVLLLVLTPQEDAGFQSVVNDGISYQRGTVVRVLSQNLEESPLGSGMLGSQELTVVLHDGHQIAVTNYLTDTHNILAKEGAKVIICVDAPDGVEPYYTLFNYDRSAALTIIFAVFVLLMFLIGRKQGANAVLAIGVSLLLVLRFTIPAICRGSSPIAIGMLTVIASTVISLLLLHGSHRSIQLNIVCQLIAGSFIVTALIDRFYRSCQIFRIGNLVRVVFCAASLQRYGLRFILFGFRCKRCR